MPTEAGKSAQLIVNKHVTLIPSATAPLLASYLTEILTWSTEIALVSRRDPVAACERLYLESLEMARVVNPLPGDHVVDIGSGAGFPGVVWSALYPAARFLLIERRERKVAFLERLVRSLPLTNVEVFGGEARSAARSDAWRGRFRIAVAMAVGDPHGIGTEIEGLLQAGARFVTTTPEEAPEGKGPFRLSSTSTGEYGRYAVYQFGV